MGQIVLGQRSGDSLDNDSKNKQGLSQQLLVACGNPQAESHACVSEWDGLGLRQRGAGEESSVPDSAPGSATYQLWNCGQMQGAALGSVISESCQNSGASHCKVAKMILSALNCGWVT